ncbi:hypothetical protein Dimus_010874 [Dionaea muscipula]
MMGDCNQAAATNPFVVAANNSGSTSSTMETLGFILASGPSKKVNYVVIAQPTNGTQTILIVFGDSTVDPGNNDYTSTWDRSKMWPYDIDFPDHIATGRFSNGRLVTDFAAAYLSGTNRTIKAYLDPNLSLEDLMQGVSFTSAGSGYNPEAAQVDTRLEAAIGAEATQTLIYKAIFILSSSTNDFFDYAFNLTGRRQQLTVSNYQQFLLSQFNNFTLVLHSEVIN